MIEYLKLLNMADIYYNKGKLKYDQKKFDDALQFFE
jgi:hypothetical protein